MAKIPKNIKKRSQKTLKNSELLSLSARQIDKLDNKNKAKLLRYFRSDYEKYDLRKQNFTSRYFKKKIEHDIDELFSFYNTANARIVRVTKKNKEKARQFSGQPSYYKKIIVPLVEGETFEASKNKPFTIKGKYWDKIKVEFKKENLVKNPEKEIKRALKNYGEWNMANIITGDTKTLGRDGAEVDFLKVKFVVEKILNLMNQYNQKQENNYFENWMDGLFIYKFKNQGSYDELTTARKKANVKKKKTRRS